MLPATPGSTLKKLCKPINQFVFDPGAEKCRGFGYVTYSMKDDADRALKEIKEYDGKRLSLCVAKKKTQGQKKPGLYKAMSPFYVAQTYWKLCS